MRGDTKDKHNEAYEFSVFRFASDVNADQTTEIDRMRLMLGVDTRK